MENYSPALSATSDLTDEELDKYFASCVPLSNLPTPPPVKEHAIPRSAPYTWTSQTSQTLQTLDRYGDADAAQFQGMLSSSFLSIGYHHMSIRGSRNVGC